MLYEIKRIPPGPIMKVSFFVFLIIGFIVGLFYGVIIFNLLSSMSGLLEIDQQIMNQYTGFGFLGMIVMGVVMSIFSSIFMTLMIGLSVVCYNVFAGWLGGFKIELNEDRLEMLKRRTVRPELFAESGESPRNNLPDNG